MWCVKIISYHLNAGWLADLSYLNDMEAPMITKFTMQRNADQRFCGKPLMGITPVFEIV
jgi:hypothetical protein